MNYQRLAKLLRAAPSFTPFSHLHYLETLGLSITIGQQGGTAIFVPILERGLPVVVGAKTLAWAHWGGIVTSHAVVVVGIDQEHGVIYVNDPFFTDAPIEMSLLQFETGWIEGDGLYGIIGLAPL